MVMKGRLSGRDKIGVRIGKVIGRYKVGKHVDLDIKDGSFSFVINEERVAAEAARQCCHPSSRSDAPVRS